MNTHCSPIRCLTILVAATIPLCQAHGPAAGGAEQTEAPAAKAATTSPDPRRDMIAALPALGPHASLREQAEVFDRFVGTWDCDFAIFSENGNVNRFSGQVLFGWILDGHAMQDIWIGYPKADSGGERDIGTTLRFFDKSSGTWRVVFVAAAYGYMIQLEGGAEGDRIVLRGKDVDGSSLRWSFNDIRADSFVWCGESSHDGGKTWWLQEEHHMKRRAAPVR